MGTFVQKPALMAQFTCYPVYIFSLFVLSKNKKNFEQIKTYSKRFKEKQSELNPLFTRPLKHI